MSSCQTSAIDLTIVPGGQVNGKTNKKAQVQELSRFLPSGPRNAWHQKYCSKPECRKAGKTASQRRWLEKEENRDHFRGSENVLRVQEWRKAHPGYWRRKTPKKPEPLQELLSAETMENQPVKTSLTKEPLQELLNSQPLVVIGLIAHLTGSALQDDIAITARRLQQLGSDILNGPTPIQGGRNDPKAPLMSTAHPKGPQPVQLGGSPSGP